MGCEAASMLDSGRHPQRRGQRREDLHQRIAPADRRSGDRPARARRTAGAPQPGSPRRRHLRAAVPGVAADAVRRRHQRGAAGRHRPARPRHAVVRTLTPMRAARPRRTRFGRDVPRRMPPSTTRTPTGSALADAGVLGCPARRYGGSGGTLDGSRDLLRGGRTRLCPRPSCRARCTPALAVDRLGAEHAGGAAAPADVRRRARHDGAVVDRGMRATSRRCSTPGRRGRLAAHRIAGLRARRAERRRRGASGRDTARGRPVFVVEPHAEGLRSEPLAMMGGQPAARLIFDGVRCRTDGAGKR